MNRGSIEEVRRLTVEVSFLCGEALEMLDIELDARNEYAFVCDEEGRDPSPADHSYGSPETAALRRRSMDLTRALARMRRPA